MMSKSQKHHSFTDGGSSTQEPGQNASTLLPPPGCDRARGDRKPPPGPRPRATTGSRDPIGPRPIVPVSTPHIASRRATAIPSNNCRLARLIHF
jgi:hypothetical protein